VEKEKTAREEERVEDLLVAPLLAVEAAPAPVGVEVVEVPEASLSASSTPLEALSPSTTRPSHLAPRELAELLGSVVPVETTV